MPPPRIHAHAFNNTVILWLFSNESVHDKALSSVTHLNSLSLLIPFPPPPPLFPSPNGKQHSLAAVSSYSQLHYNIVNRWVYDSWRTHKGRICLIFAPYVCVCLKVCLSAKKKECGGQKPWIEKVWRSCSRLLHLFLLRICHCPTSFPPSFFFLSFKLWLSLAYLFRSGMHTKMGMSVKSLRSGTPLTKQYAHISWIQLFVFISVLSFARFQMWYRFVCLHINTI